LSFYNPLLKVNSVELIRDGKKKRVATSRVQGGRFISSSHPSA